MRPSMLRSEFTGLVLFQAKINNLKDVVDGRLCAGCGACRCVLPEGAVSMIDIESDGIRPSSIYTMR